MPERLVGESGDRTMAGEIGALHSKDCLWNVVSGLFLAMRHNLVWYGLVPTTVFFVRNRVVEVSGSIHLLTTSKSRRSIRMETTPLKSL